MIYRTWDIYLCIFLYGVAQTLVNLRYSLVFKPASQFIERYHSVGLCNEHGGSHFV
jgi:hypothetical protein